VAGLIPTTHGVLAALEVVDLAEVVEIVEVVDLAEAVEALMEVVQVEVGNQHYIVDLNSTIHHRKFSF
jgi:hypothetical protein